jgi:peptidoglycan/LPS O-acetylase OafA/YrhL
MPAHALVEAPPAAVPVSAPYQSNIRYRSLDALRGIAAFVVVIHHCLVSLPVWSDVMLHGVHNSIITVIFGYPPLDLLWAGDAAVKVFFALSGFVLALMFLRPDPPSYAVFVVKRVCRIYLPYVVVVAAGMFLMTVTAPHHTPELSQWFNASWNRGISRPLILDHALMLGQQQYNFVDNPIWSLVHEMRYSLIFPMVMWLVMRVKWQLLAASSLLISTGAIGAVSHTGNNWAVDSLQFAFLFVAGAELAKHRMKVAEWFQNLTHTYRITLGVISLLLLSTHGLVNFHIHAVRVFAYVAPHIGAVLLLISVIGSKWAQGVLENKPCLWVGRVSYSLYLSHAVLLLTLVSILNGIIPIYAILVGLPPLALALAGLLYRFVEKPAIALGYALANRIDALPSLGTKAAEAVCSQPRNDFV